VQVIDLHCHILPGVDDGPATLEGALDMARAHVAAGVRTVAATPHVSWDMPTSSERVARDVPALQRELRAAGIDLEVTTGGELAVSRVGDLADDELRALALGGGPWLLVEPPLASSSLAFEAILHTLQGRGHRVLLAHPERCPAFQREPERLRALVDAGMLCSITAGSLIGHFGSTVERFAHRLVRDGLVHNVASDAHDSVRRAPGLREAVEAAGYGDRAGWWCDEVPGALLAGTEVPDPPAGLREPEPERQGLLGRLFRSGGPRR
jgi:protein-tyrosine phosphatase